MKRIFTVIVLTLLFALSSKAQNSDSSKVKGTYTIQMVNTRDLPSIPYNLEKQVEAARDKEKVTFLKLSPYVRVKIYPTTEISKPNYKPAKEIEYVRE